MPNAPSSQEIHAVLADAQMRGAAVKRGAAGVRVGAGQRRRPAPPCSNQLAHQHGADGAARGIHGDGGRGADQIDRAAADVCRIVELDAVGIDVAAHARRCGGGVEIGRVPASVKIQGLVGLPGPVAPRRVPNSRATVAPINQCAGLGRTGEEQCGKQAGQQTGEQGDTTSFSHSSSMVEKTWLREVFMGLTDLGFRDLGCLVRLTKTWSRLPTCSEATCR